MKYQYSLTQGIELIALGEATLAQVQGRLRGCAACSRSASHSLETVLRHVLGTNGMTQYFLGTPLRCPRCSAPVLEKTLVDFHGKAKVAVEAECTYFELRDQDQDVVFVDESTLLDAQNFVAACEYCCDAAEIPFDQLLDAITGCDPSTTEYVICHAAKCGGCHHDIMEKTLIVSR